MKLLLDTHIWLWSLVEPERLGKRILRVYLAADVMEWIARNTAPFREAHLTHEIAAAVRNLPLAQKDPADRFLAATAKVLNLTLVTADANLLGLGDIATLANR